MAHARTWNLRLNLDDFNAVCAGLSDDHEMAEFLRGFIRGVNAGNPKMACSGEFEEAFTLGRKMRDEVDAFRLKAQEDGAKGGPKTWKNPPKPTPPNTPPNTPPEPYGSPGGSPSGEPNPLILNPLILNPETSSNKEPPVPPQGGGEEIRVAPPKGKASGKWEDLFGDRPDALPYFQAIFSAHAKMRETIKGRIKLGTVRSKGVPDLDPGPGATSFLLLVNGGHSPRLLRAMHHCYLKHSQHVADGFLQGLKVFFGAPGKSKKCTWEGFRDEAVRFLADLETSASQPAPPPAAPSPLPLLDLNVLPPSCLALPPLAKETPHV